MYARACLSAADCVCETGTWRTRRRDQRRRRGAARRKLASRIIWFGNTTELSDKALEKFLSAPAEVAAWLSVDTR